MSVLHSKLNTIWRFNLDKRRSEMCIFDEKLLKKYVWRLCAGFCCKIESASYIFNFEKVLPMSSIFSISVNWSNWSLLGLMSSFFRWCWLMDPFFAWLINNTLVDCALRISNVELILKLVVFNYAIDSIDYMGYVDAFIRAVMFHYQVFGFLTFVVNINFYVFAGVSCI